MSEKLRSIPKETIQVAPKEVVLPEFKEPNGFLPGCSQESKASESDSDKSEENDIDAAKPNVDGTSCIAEQTEVTGVSSVHQVHDEPETKELSGDVEIKEEPKIEHEEQTKKQTNEQTNEQTEERNEFNEPEGEAEHSNESDKCEDEDDDDEFGDFADFQESVKHPEDNQGEDDKLQIVPPLNLDDDEDDDFGDFAAGQQDASTPGQQNKFEAFASSSGWASLDSSPRGQIDQILIGVSLKKANMFRLVFN